MQQRFPLQESLAPNMPPVSRDVQVFLVLVSLDSKWSASSCRLQCGSYSACLKTTALTRGLSAVACALYQCCCLHLVLLPSHAHRHVLLHPCQVLVQHILPRNTMVDLCHTYSSMLAQPAIACTCDQALEGTPRVAPFFLCLALAATPSPPSSGGLILLFHVRLLGRCLHEGKICLGGKGDAHLGRHL